MALGLELGPVLELALVLGLVLEPGQRNHPKSTRLPIQLPEELKKIFSL